MSTATAEFLDKLSKLKDGDMAKLRLCAHRGLDEDIEGFDIFTGVWWPLRQRTQWAPRRSVAWLVAKLFATYRFEQEEGHAFMRLLGECEPNIKRDPKAHERFRRRTDALMTARLDDLEPHLRWALDEVTSHGCTSLDWVKFTNQLSDWEKEKTRLEWANEYLNNQPADNR